MLRAATLPRGPQDETTADIEVHLYGAHRSKLKASSPWNLALSRIATGFVIETGSGPRPG
jgi:hypothetical protein